MPLQSNASVLTDNDFLHQAANCAKALVAEFYDTCDSVAHSVCFTHCIISTFSTSITTFCNGFTFQNSSQSKLILIPFHCIEYCVYFSNRCSSGRQSSYILVSFLPERWMNSVTFCRTHILPTAPWGGSWWQLISGRKKYNSKRGKIQGTHFATWIKRLTVGLAGWQVISEPFSQQGGLDAIQSDTAALS